MVQSLQEGLSAFFSYIPQLIGAILILIVGYIVAKLLEAVVTRLLGAIGFEHWLERGGIKQFFERAETRQTPTSILGRLVFWLVFIIAIVMATDALGISQVSAVLAELIAYIPNVIAAVLILILAALLANFLAGIIRGATGSDILATVARVAIIVYAVFAALTGHRGAGGRQYVIDRARRGGAGCGPSVRFWSPKCRPRHRGEGLRPAQ